MKNGGFYLGHYNKGLICPGTFIDIYSLGHFKMGEIYLGFFKIKLKQKGLTYYNDGKKGVEFDEPID